MSNHSEAFDRWIRSSFMEINTELENLYFAQDDRADVTRSGQNLKTQLRDEGHVHVVALLAEGDTGDGFETRSACSATSACTWPRCGATS